VGPFHGERSLSRHLTRAVAVLLAIHLLGGHWMLLQTAAWVGMFVNFSKQASVVVALEKTLDGDHPCSVCHVVTKGKTEEKKQEASKSLLKFEAVIAAVARVGLRHGEPVEHRGYGEVWVARRLAPPSPPPWLA
jgi:hypothetical protein